MLLAFQAVPVTISNPDMTLSALSSALSRSGQIYSAAPAVARRRVAVFVKGKKANDIAKMVALTLGVQLKGARFEPDPAYEALSANHMGWLRKIGEEALRRAINDLRASPPQWVGEQKGRYDWELKRITNEGWKRPPNAFEYKGGTTISRQQAIDQLRDSILNSGSEVIVLLSSLSGPAVEQLMQGKYVIGSIPQRPNTIYMAKSTARFERLKSFKQAYVMLRYNAIQNCLEKAHYTPGMERPNAYAGKMYLGNSYTLEAFTPLGQKWKNWDEIAYGIMKKIYPVMSQPGNVTDSILLQRVAKAVQVPLIAERHDPPEGPLRPDWSRLSAYKRSEGGWLLLKPSMFWVRPANNLTGPAPTSGTITERFNWAATAITSTAVAGAYAFPDLDFTVAKFWAGLSVAERAKVLGAGIKAAQLSPTSQDALFNAAIRLSLTRVWPKGDISAILERSPSVSIKIDAHNIWYVFRQDANGGSESFGARTRSEAEKFMKEAHYQGSKLHAGVGYTLRINAPKGYLENRGNLILGELPPALRRRN